MSVYPQSLVCYTIMEDKIKLTKSLFMLVEILLLEPVVEKLQVRTDYEKVARIQNVH